MKEQISQAQQSIADLDAWIAEKLMATPPVQRQIEAQWVKPRIVAIRQALAEAGEFVQAAQEAVSEKAAPKKR